MMYRKLSVRWTVQPESLYRTFMVPEDMELQELGCLILTALHVKEYPAFEIFPRNSCSGSIRFFRGSSDAERPAD